MKKLLLFFLLCCTFICKAQQQAMYTQYMFNTLAINPAYASLDESFVITGLARQQWTGFKGAPQTQTLSLHTPIGESNTFIGGMLMNDQIAEVIQETGGYITLSQRVELYNNTYLSVGFNGGASSYRANFSENFPSSPESVNDPVFQNTKEMRANFGFGVMLFSDKYYVGFSSPHFYNRDFGSLTEIKTEGRYKPHYMIQGGYLIDVGYNIKLKPNFLMKYVNGSPLQIDINANVLLAEKLWLGASYRTKDSFDFMASLYITNDIQFGYSYDATNTKLAKIQKGSHEVMLKFRMPVRGRDHTACYF